MIVQSENQNLSMGQQPEAEVQFGQVSQAMGSPGAPILPEHTGQSHQSIPAAPLLHQVQPGDLITAQYFNDLVLAVQNLQARIELLETPSYYRAQSDTDMDEAVS